MRAFLVFTLFAPLAAHGEIAVGERRMSWRRPGRSAILGLLAAALGKTRDDEAAHQALDAAYWLGIREEASGRPLFDYHTIQVPGAKKNVSFATRREELQAKELNTTVSQREWRCDSLYTIALWRRGAETVPEGLDLPALKRALDSPYFTLYVGRKSGPLAWPPCPAIEEAESLIEALQRYDEGKADRSLRKDYLAGICNLDRCLAFDAAAEADGAPTPQRRFVRRDRLMSRRRWHFAEREEGEIDYRREPALERHS